MAGNYLADHWGERRIAVLHDGTPYVKGLAEQSKKQLNERGVAEGLYEQVEREAVDYGICSKGFRARASTWCIS
jgi:branched-chain amino acid transport system substrate-binding protein